MDDNHKIGFSVPIDDFLRRSVSLLRRENKLSWLRDAKPRTQSCFHSSKLFAFKKCNRFFGACPPRPWATPSLRPLGLLPPCRRHSLTWDNYNYSNSQRWGSKHKTRMETNRMIVEARHNWQKFPWFFKICIYNFVDCCLCSGPPRRRPWTTGAAARRREVRQPQNYYWMLIPWIIVSVHTASFDLSFSKLYQHKFYLYFPRATVITINS